MKRRSKIYAGSRRSQRSKRKRSERRCRYIVDDKKKKGGRK
jgi:hypothetical protein